MSRRSLLKIKDNPFTSGVFSGGSQNLMSFLGSGIMPQNHYDNVLDLYDQFDRSYVIDAEGNMAVRKTEGFAFIQIVPASHNLYGDGKACYMYCRWHDSTDIKETAYIQTQVSTSGALGLVTAKSPTPVYVGQGLASDPRIPEYVDVNADDSGNSNGLTYLSVAQNKNYNIHIPTFKKDWGINPDRIHLSAISGMTYPGVWDSTKNNIISIPPFCGDYFHQNPVKSTNNYTLLNSKTTVTDQAATSTNTVQTHNPQRLIKQYFGTNLYLPSIAELMYLAAQINPLNDLLNRLNWYKLCLDNKVDYKLNEQDYSRHWWLNYYYLNFSCQGGGLSNVGYVTNNIKTYPYILSSTRAYVANSPGDYYWALDISDLNRPKAVTVSGTTRGLLVAFARF